MLRIGGVLSKHLPTVTVNVIQLNTSGVETTIYSNLTAVTKQEEKTDWGEGFGPFADVGSKVVDNFYFQKTGASALPTITEEHILRVGTTDYNVKRVIDLNGLGEMLKVVTERVRALV